MAKTSGGAAAAPKTNRKAGTRFMRPYFSTHGRYAAP